MFTHVINMYAVYTHVYMYIHTDVTLRDISSIQRDNPDNIPGKGDVLNFLKWRQLSKVLLTFHQYKNLYYNLLVVEVSITVY